MLHPLVQSQLSTVVELFKIHKIKSTYALGLIVSGVFNDDSDIDFLISFEDEFGPIETRDIWWHLHDDLRNVFNREIDLLIEPSLKNPYFIEEINEKKQLIYAA